MNKLFPAVAEAHGVSGARVPSEPLLLSSFPFYQIPLHALKSGCNRAVLIEGFFCTKSMIGEKVQVDGALQGDRFGLLDVLVAELVNRPPTPKGGSRSASDCAAPWAC